MAIYKNITSATTVDLINKNAGSGNINCINISNYGAQQATILLFVEDATAAETTNPGNNKFYYLTTIMPGVTNLKLNENISFNSSIYNLRISVVGLTPRISVIIT